MRESFQAHEGATKTEWQAVCVGMVPSTFYRVSKTLVERGYVAQAGSKFRLTDKAIRP